MLWLVSIEELSLLAEEQKASFIRSKLIEAGIDTEDLLRRSNFEVHSGSGLLELAVSGGADSVAMLVLGYLYTPQIRVWHLDHQLRPSSGEEANFVRAIASALSVEVQVFQERIEPGTNLEERAREIRRSIFIDGVATGHTADDQSETMVINLIRGSGVHGLGSISVGPEHPILNLRRDETEAVCRALSLSFVVDESNVDPKFLRNRVRHEVIPLLCDVSKRDVVPILARTARILQKVSAFVTEQAEKIDPTQARELAAADEIIATEAIRRWLADEKGHSLSYELAQDVLRVARGEKVATDLPGAIRVRRSRGRLSKFKISERTH